MNLKTVTVADLKPHPDNPNTHPTSQIEALADSLTTFTQVKNVVIWNDRIIAGHGVVEAAKRAGILTLEVNDVSHWDEAKATAFMLADIRLPDMAIIDDEVMAEALRAIDEPLDIPGFDEDFLAGIGGLELVNYSDFNNQLENLQEFRDINITITIPAKYENEVKEWLSNGEGVSSPQMGRGVLIRCGLL